jgi:ubiquinone/menaquinone biosynthesis C-methylase UbiE
VPSIEENLDYFDRRYDWPKQGDEWSSDFGGTDALWWFTIFPRISPFLPARRILEIGPGHGRWTVHLLSSCQSLVLVDLSPACIEQCKARFAGASNITYHVTDGKSLGMLPSNSVDFVFSFDSLVHAEADVIQAYVEQLASILTQEGAGFIHHSNLGQYARRLALIKKFPRKKWNLRPQAARMLSINTRAWRAESMTGARFRDMCASAGLRCFSQELINWGRGRCMIDAFSCFARPNSPWDRPPLVVKNPSFARLSQLLSKLAPLYFHRQVLGAGDHVRMNGAFQGATGADDAVRLDGNR